LQRDVPEIVVAVTDVISRTDPWRAMMFQVGTVVRNGGIIT